jgi:hypothetical protein
VSTVADVDALLDRLTDDSALGEVPPLMQLSRRDPDGWAVLHIGIHTDRGILTHTNAAGSFVTTDGTNRTNGTITYDYMGHLREAPANAEIPLTHLREAVHEFVLTNGHRPASVHWQPDQ